MIWRQFISNIQSQIKAISSDVFIPPRFIYSITQNVISDLLRKDNDSKKKLSQIAEGWSELECIELEEVDVIQCPDIDVRLCSKMMKSVQPIPDIYSYSYGNIIEYTASPNWAYFFDPTTPRKWKNIQKQKYKDKNKYYYFIIDHYLYLPIPKEIDLPIESLRMKAYFIDKRQTEKFKTFVKCDSCPKQTPCTSTLDYEMVVPSYLTSDVENVVIQKLSQVYLKVQGDNYPNLNNLELDNRKDLQTYGQ